MWLGEEHSWLRQQWVKSSGRGRKSKEASVTAAHAWAGEEYERRSERSQRTPVGPKGPCRPLLGTVMLSMGEMGHHCQFMKTSNKCWNRITLAAAPRRDWRESRSRKLVIDFWNYPGEREWQVTPGRWWRWRYLNPQVFIWLDWDSSPVILLIQKKIRLILILQIHISSL